ncbi:MAG: cytochrome [Myxococcaceae bacterium]|nr:cytochrome [Myxococcaceae bacterium]
MTLPPSFPPGPRGLVEVATTFRRFMNEPEAEFRAAHARWGDTLGFRLGRDRIVVLGDPGLIGEVLVNTDGTWVKDRVTRDLSVFLGMGLLTNEGASWRRQRKLLSPSLTRRHIALYADAMVGCARRYADRLADGDERDVHADMSAVTLEIVTETLFGAAFGHDPTRVGHAIDSVMVDFQELVQTWRRFLPATVPFAARRRMVESSKEIDAVVMEVIHRRRRTGERGDDLLSRLLEARDDEGSGMSDQQLRDEAVTLFVAGHETTANALSFALMFLGDHPEVDARLRDEVARVLGDRPATADDVAALRLTDAVARETMRLYPPAHLIGREATRDVALGPYRLPRGTAVLISPWALQRDPRHWPDPLAFRPDRWLDGSAERAPKNAYLPFGGGPRVCIGNHFAQMELVLVLATIARRARFERVSAAPVRVQAAITLRPAGGLRMRVARRGEPSAPQQE